MIIEQAEQIVEKHISRTVERRRRLFNISLAKKQHSLQIVDRTIVELHQGAWEDAVLFSQLCKGENSRED